MMEAALNRIEINGLKRVCSACISCEETAESVVPDVLPDICEIVDADGIVLLRTKTAETGRVSLSGIVNTTVLYMPEDGSGICRLSIEMPFSISYDCGEVDENSRPEAMVRLRTMDARMLNPRKVLIRADLEADICAYNESTRTVCGGIEDGSEAGIHILGREFSFTSVSSVKEKTFVLTDEYQLPASMPPLGVMLKERLELSVDDVKSVGNKMIFKGIAKFDLLYTGEEGEPLSAAWSSSFSQILEMDVVCDNPEMQVSLMLTGAYFEPLDTAQDGRVITTELHIVAQAKCMERTECAYIADAYSNRYDLNMRTESMEFYSVERSVALRETVRDLMETPESVNEIVGVYTAFGQVAVEQGTVRCPVSVRAIYKDAGGVLLSSTKRVMAQCAFEVEERAYLEGVTVRCAEVYASPVSGGIDLRLPVDVTANICKKIKIDAVTEITADTEQPISTASTPSVTVLQSPSSDLWTLAKKYRSTPELILAANKITSIEEADGLILIPGCR